MDLRAISRTSLGQVVSGDPLSQKASRDGYWLGGLFVVCLATGLFWINHSWGYLDVEKANQAIDPHVYLGCFYNLKEYLKVFDGTYYITRLPAILTGAFFRQFSDEIGIPAHRLFYVIVSALSTFLVVSRLTSDRIIGSLTTVLLITDTHFLKAAGWDYIDGTGLSLICVSNWLVSYAGTNRRRIALFALIGFVQGLMLVTNFFLVTIIFWQAILAIWLTRPANLSTLSGAALGALIGIILAFATLGALNAGIGGRFLFLLPQISFAFRPDLSASLFRSQDLNWVWGSTSLLFNATVAAAGALVALSCRRFLSAPNFAPAGWSYFLLAHAAIFLSFLLMEAVGFSVLQIPYYAIYMHPFAHVSLGIMLWVGLRNLTQVSRLAVLGSTTAIALFIWYWASAIATTVQNADCCNIGRAQSLVLIGAILGVVVLAVTCGQGILSTRHAAVRIVVAFISCGFLIYNSIRISDPYIFEFPLTGNSQKNYLTFLRFRRDVEVFRMGVVPKIWYSKADRQANFFRAYSSSWLYAFRLVSTEFPDIDNPISKQMNLFIGETVLLLSSHCMDDANIDAALSGRGLKRVPGDKSGRFAIGGSSACGRLFGVTSAGMDKPSSH